MLTKTDLFELLSVKNKDFQIHDHDPLFTVEDSENLRGEIKGAHTKNLFLKNKKNNFFLFSCDENAKVDLKLFSKSINAKNLSFANDKFLALIDLENSFKSTFAFSSQLKRKKLFFLFFKNKFFVCAPLISPLRFSESSTVNKGS